MEINCLVDGVPPDEGLTQVAKAKALQDQQQGPAWNNKRMCAALVCVAIWTYAIIYFAALYSYRPSRVKINQWVSHGDDVASMAWGA